MKILFYFILLNITYSFAQDDMTQREKMIKEFMESRKIMMDKMLDAFGQDDFFEDDMDDDFFKSVIGDRFKNFQSSKMVTVESLKNNDGSIDVFIRPIDKSVQLDIETKSNAIVVKAKQVEKFENKNKAVITSRLSNQSMTQTVPIPRGYKALSPKEVEGKILIKLVKNESTKTDRTPLLKGDADDII